MLGPNGLSSFSLYYFISFCKSFIYIFWFSIILCALLNHLYCDELCEYVVNMVISIYLQASTYLKYEGPFLLPEFLESITEILVLECGQFCFCFVNAYHSKIRFGLSNNYLSFSQDLKLCFCCRRCVQQQCSKLYDCSF